MCWVVTYGQCLPQVSDPSSLGAVREGLQQQLLTGLRLLQTYFLRDPASCLQFIPCTTVSSQHVRLGSFLFPWNSQATLGRGASGQALRDQDNGYLLCIQRGKRTWHFTMERAKTV